MFRFWWKIRAAISHSGILPCIAHLCRIQGGCRPFWCDRIWRNLLFGLWEEPKMPTVTHPWGHCRWSQTPLSRWLGFGSGTWNQWLISIGKPETLPFLARKQLAMSVIWNKRATQSRRHPKRPWRAMTKYKRTNKRRHAAKNVPCSSTYHLLVEDKRVTKS